MGNEILNLKGTYLKDISFNPIEVRFIFSNDFVIFFENLGILEIMPCNFPCPQHLSLHSQILWLADVIFDFMGEEIINVQYLENTAILLETMIGKIAINLANPQFIRF